MTRREFIGCGLGAAGAMVLSGCTGLTREDRTLRLACQMWSVKDIWQKNGDITSVFPRLAALGYEGVQSKAFWDCDPDRLEKALVASGLKIADMPVGFAELETESALAKTVAFCKRFDVDFVYIPWFKSKTLDGWRDFARKLDEYGRQLAPQGIRIGYHNHLHEFTERVDGFHPGDVLVNYPTFNFELDVGPILESRRSPSELLRKMPGRVPGIHAKPYPGSYAGASNDRQDWPAILAAAQAIGTKWIVVECEQRKNTFADVKASAVYFRRLGV